MIWEIKLTVLVESVTSTEALKKVHDRVEPPGIDRSDNGMYIETVDKIARKSRHTS